MLTWAALLVCAPQTPEETATAGDQRYGDVWWNALSSEAADQ